MLIWPCGVLSLLPPVHQIIFRPESSTAHNIATFLMGENNWRFNPNTTIAVILAVCFVLLTEAMVRIRIHMTTTATTTSPGGTGRNSNPIKNMTVIQGISTLLFSFLQMTLINHEDDWGMKGLVFPRILLGTQSTLMFVLFFLWSAGARSYTWRKLSGWRVPWAEVREGSILPSWWRARVAPTIEGEGRTHLDELVEGQGRSSAWR